MSEILITKASGLKEPWRPEKLRDSLFRVGVKSADVETIVAHIEKELHDGMSTGEIYGHASFLLRKLEKPAARRYSLRRAVFELGPTGFPFERFVAELFKAKGFSAAVGQFVDGSCARHEIDCLVWNENKVIVVEVKFHHEAGIRSDIKIALYVKARFDDLAAAKFDCGGERRRMDEGWLMTNTKFSQGAIDYAVCSGLKLVGWNYPSSGNLHDLIEDSGLHPLTALSALSAGEKKILLERGTVLCRSLRENTEAMRSVGLSQPKIDEVLKEIKELEIS